MANPELNKEGVDSYPNLSQADWDIIASRVIESEPFFQALRSTDVVKGQEEAEKNT